MIPEVVAELAATVARDWMPAGLCKSIFVNTGSESNEVAPRMAKMYTGGYEIVAVGGSCHWVTGGTSAVSFASDRKGYGVHAPGVYVMHEPDDYRPYIKGLLGEESALACLEIGLKMYDMPRPAGVRPSSSSPSLVPAACWCRPSRTCRRCARPPMNAACC